MVESCDYLSRPFYGSAPTSIEVEDKSSADWLALFNAVCFGESWWRNVSDVVVAIMSSIGGLWKQVLGPTSFG